MRCPTCGKDGLIITAKICPRCDTQLTSDYELDDAPALLHRKTHSLLKGKVVELARRKEKLEQKNSRLIGYLTIASLIILSSLVLKSAPEPEIVQQNNQGLVDSLHAQLSKKHHQIQQLEQQLSNRSKDSIEYIIQPGDNLTKISQLFYNEDSLLFSIAGENGIPIPDKILAGDTILIYLIR
ncbi:MAG: LysM domain-containing protein [Bacteroidota bacterium]